VVSFAEAIQVANFFSEKETRTSHMESKDSKVCMFELADIRKVSMAKDVYEPCEDSFALVDAVASSWTLLQESRPQLSVSVCNPYEYLVSHGLRLSINFFRFLRLCGSLSYHANYVMKTIPDEIY